MSSYVDALERWDEEAGCRGTAGGTPAANAEGLGRVCDRIDAAASAGPLLAVVAGVAGRERAADVARGCAEGFAARGRRVLLVDLDPPAAGRPGAAGLATLLRDDADVAPAAGGGVAVVLADPGLDGRPHGFEAAVADWLERQRGGFDRIVVHAGGVLDGGTAPALAARADLALLVVRARWTPRSEVVAARRRLAGAGARVLGAVLTDARPLPPLLARVLRALSFAAAREG